MEGSRAIKGNLQDLASIVEMLAAFWHRFGNGDLIWSSKLANWQTGKLATAAKEIEMTLALFFNKFGYRGGYNHQQRCE